MTCICRTKDGWYKDYVSVLQFKSDSDFVINFYQSGAKFPTGNLYPYAEYKSSDFDRLIHSTKRVVNNK